MNVDRRTSRGQILLVAPLVAALLAPTLLAQWLLLRSGGEPLQTLFALAFAAWVLALPVLMLGSTRRALLFWLPAGLLAPLQCYLILFFGGVPGDAVTASALHVSRMELAEVLSGFGLLPLLLPLCWLVYWQLWRRLAPHPVLRAAQRKRLAATLLTCALLGLGIGRAVSGAATSLSGFAVISSTFPASTVLSAARVLAADHELQPDTFGARAPATPLTVVLVIGESVRADHLGLLGYARDTTPLLAGTRENLLLFRDMATTANYTYAAVPNIVRRKIGAHTASLVSLFQEAGFHTAWFSSQERSLFEPHADLSEFADAPGTRPDSVLLPAFADCLRRCGPRQFIVLHMYGSHFPYDARYTANDRRFTPTFSDASSPIVGPRYRQELVNSYDNTLLALDRFLAESVRLALDGERPAVVLYTSDHGENLGDDERQFFMHIGPQPTRAETMVPLLVWTNAAYRAQAQDKMDTLRRHLNMPLNHLTVFPTLLDLASVRFPGFDASESVASPSFAPRPRVVSVVHGPLTLVEQLR